jgi:hypothetical protein
MAADEFKVVAVGTYLYAGTSLKRIELLCRPAERANSRWIEDAAGDFVLDQAAPIPSTPDGLVYYVGATSGGEFVTLAAAMAWADAQPWAPIEWNIL